MTGSPMVKSLELRAKPHRAYGLAEMRWSPLSRVTKPHAFFKKVQVVHRLFKHFLSLCDGQISAFRPPLAALPSRFSPLFTLCRFYTTCMHRRLRFFAPNERPSGGEDGGVDGFAVAAVLLSLHTSLGRPTATGDDDRERKSRKGERERGEG